MNRRPDMSRAQTGAALIASLGVLLVFSLMGAAYVGYMVIEWDAAQAELSTMRARQTAEAGVQAAIATVERALRENLDVPAYVGDLESGLTVPLYTWDGASLVAEDGLTGVARVRIADECRRINVNFVPTPVLSAILGIDLDAARAIRERLPRIPGDDAGSSDGSARWLATVDELETRGLVEPGVLDEARKEFLTVYSVTDPEHAAGFINVNTAEPEVLAAVLGLDLEQAAAVRAAALETPFATAEQLAAAAGKEPSAFNVKPSPEAPGALPGELGFTTRCFRIVSEGVIEEDGQTLRGGIRIEAVVFFDEAGRARVQYWNETRGVRAPDGTAPAEGAASAA